MDIATYLHIYMYIYVYTYQHISIQEVKATERTQGNSERVQIRVVQHLEVGIMVCLDLESMRGMRLHGVEVQGRRCRGNDEGFFVSLCTQQIAQQMKLLNNMPQVAQRTPKTNAGKMTCMENKHTNGFHRKPSETCIHPSVTDEFPTGPSLHRQNRYGSSYLGVRATRPCLQAVTIPSGS